MGDNVKFEVALEVISMYISIAIANNDMELAERLKKEKKEMYLGNNKLVEKVIDEYGKKIKDNLGV
ncbi:MAG: hypothetical protein J6D03_08300 [Clostridia bacterium]|nr:hypothetical protein [Clostridia bacterium]